MRPCRSGKLRDIAAQALRKIHLLNLRDARRKLLGGHYGSDLVRRILTEAVEQDTCLLLHGGVAHAYLDHKAVKLSLRQRECPDIPLGILRCNNDERLGKLVYHAVDGDALLLHRFQQRRLCFRRGAVYLIGKQYIRHNETRAVLETVLLAVEHRESGDVGSHHVRRKLRPAE